MKLMQQQSVQGQPPEKKLRVNGGYTNGNDTSNYDYQVNCQFSISISILFLCISREILINNDFSLYK
jgi:hypothetical protein